MCVHRTHRLVEDLLLLFFLIHLVYYCFNFFELYVFNFISGNKINKIYVFNEERISKEYNILVDYYYSLKAFLDQAKRRFSSL